jgi:hypothetical protein
MRWLRFSLGKCNTLVGIRSLSLLPSKKAAAPSLRWQTQKVGCKVYEFTEVVE